MTNRYLSASQQEASSYLHLLPFFVALVLIRQLTVPNKAVCQLTVVVPSCPLIVSHIPSYFQLQSCMSVTQVHFRGKRQTPPFAPSKDDVTVSIILHFI